MELPSLSLVIPVYNAAALLPAVLGAIESFVSDYGAESVEVLLVDDHSDDATRTILAAYAHRHTFARVLRNHTNRGKGYTVARGMLAARGQFRVFTDVDLAYPLDQVDRIVADLEGGADVAIACRVLEGSRYLMSPKFFHYLYSRHLMSRGFNAVVRRTLLPGILDTQAGLKGFTAEAAVHCFSRLTIEGFGFDVECLFIARQRGLTIRQTAVDFRYDQEPTTVRFLSHGAGMLRDLWTIKANDRRRRYDTLPGQGNADVDRAHPPLLVLTDRAAS